MRLLQNYITIIINNIYLYTYSNHRVVVLHLLSTLPIRYKSNTDREYEFYNGLYISKQSAEKYLQRGFFFCPFVFVFLSTIYYIRQWIWRTNQRSPTMARTSHHRLIRDGCWTWVGGHRDIRYVQGIRIIITTRILWLMTRFGRFECFKSDLRTTRWQKE